MSKIDCVICNARTKAGGTCSRKTCKYANRCWQHTKQASHGFILKKSKIEGAGQGLFASKRIPPNTKIADYGGVLKTKEAYDRNPSGYGIEVNRVDGVRMVRDSASTQSGYGRWANDGGTTPTQG